MAHQNEDLVRDFLGALGQGDIDTPPTQYWAEDIRMHVPGRSSIAGDHKGAEQVLQALARLAELTGGTFSFEVHDVVANDEHAVALYIPRAERAGKQWTDNSVAVYHIRDGKISEIWIQPADLYAMDEFLS
jgi:ketosteroid isomerase-like protein